MTKVSSLVVELENTVAKYKAAAKGNCVLRNREGFEKPFSVDSGMLHGAQDCYMGHRPPMRHIKFWERRENPDFSTSSYTHNYERGSAIKEVTYHNTGRTDDFGRTILEEM